MQLSTQSTSATFVVVSTTSLLDGCDNITLKFEKSEAELSTQMLLTSKEYLRLFGEYAVCVGRQKHRKDAKCKKRERATEGKVRCFSSLLRTLSTPSGSDSRKTVRSVKRSASN